MDTWLPRAASTGARRAAACLGLGLLLLAGGPVRAEEDRSDRDREAIPPAVIWPQPDKVHEPLIRQLMSNAFGDMNKTPLVRERLVWQYHLWSVPQLAAELRGSNQQAVWNAALTVAALRTRRGPAPELWPALGPLVALLRSPEPRTRVFAALALGCFRWREGMQPDRQMEDSLHRDPIPQMKRTLAEAEDGLVDLLNFGGIAWVRTAALLALAKRGGASASERLLERYRRDETAAEPRWAALIAQAFLRAPSGAPYFDGLATEDERLRRAAALALSIGMLVRDPPGQDPPAWTTHPDRLLKTLKALPLNPTEGPEAVFARGVVAYRYQQHGDWRAIWDIAIQNTSEREVAIAAAQALLFCREPWFFDLVVRWAAGAGGGKLKAPVLAAFLLRSGQGGTAAGVEACAHFLATAARRPRPKPEWDVRFHAAVGILRALHSGKLTEPALRERALEALHDGVERGMQKDAPFRLALASLLAEEGPRLLANPLNRLPEASLRKVEASFDCPYALLASDLIDVCVHRVNAFVPLLFNLDSIKPGSAGEPQTGQVGERILDAYFAYYPYFTRLEFLPDRGWRARPELDTSDPMVLDR